MTNLKRRVASHKILQFLENHKVIFFFQKKSVQNDHWRLLKKKIAKVEGVASLNLKNRRDKKEIQPLILSLHQRCKDPRESVSVDLFYDLKKIKVNPLFDCSTVVKTPHVPCKNVFLQDTCGANVKQHRESGNGSEMVERICGLLYAPNLILGSNSLKNLAFLSHQLKEDSNLIFIGGWDGNQLINHLDSLKLLETPQDIWKEGLSCLSSCYGRPYLFFCSLLEKRTNFLVSSLKEKMRALTRSLQERQAQQIKEQ